MIVPDYKIVIIGAGVVGLAIARSLARLKIDSVLVIEKESNYGRGISSRNSEVIHSGIYYPINTLKSKYCIKGRKLIYNYCKVNNIYHKQCGKIIVAKKNQKQELQALMDLGQHAQINSIKWLTKKDISKLEGLVEADYGIYIPETGIIDSHGLMNSFYNESVNINHDYLFKSELIGCSKINRGYEIHLKTPATSTEIVKCDWIINASGLNSDLIAHKIMGNQITPSLVYSKGYYFSLNNKWHNKFSHLIYPIPDKDQHSLGIHISFNKKGHVKLGPDAHFLKNRNENYSMDESLLHIFYKAALQYIPNLNIEDLSPDYSGIRPKINSKGYTFQDFYIQHEIENSFPGLINLIGIDSPGLTSAIAIGEDIASWIE